jgi:hypothetical protein
MYANSEGYWQLKKEKLKERYPDITEEDLQYNDGKELVMMEILANKLGKTTDELRYILAEL